MSDSSPSRSGEPLSLGMILAAVVAIVFLLSLSLYLWWPQSNRASQQAGASSSRSSAEFLRGLTTIDSGRRFLTSQCADLQSNLWAGSEDRGVWRFDPTAQSASKWVNFSVSNGLGDEDVTAVACDRKGRIWAGQGRSGVSVWNGVAWRNYGAASKTSGPIGEHIFCIEICPTDGDVWMCTNAGITRYSESADRWTNYTRADGLPSDQATAIAFNKAGDVFVATQCDGLAKAMESENYAHWQHIDGPDQFLTEPRGTGLPSNRLNDVLAVDNDQVFVASPEGLGWSRDAGAHWNYFRGQDWQVKLARRADHRQAAQPLPVTDALLPDDYVTSLAVNADPTVLAACRSGAAIQLLPRGNDLLQVMATAAAPAQLPHDLTKYQTALSYGRGIVILGDSQITPAPTANAAVTAAFPTPAAPPDLATLNQQLAEISRVPPLLPGARPVVETLPDDWTTRGDWIGRYGRYQCAISSIAQPDYIWGGAPDPLQYSVSCGPHVRPNDSCRFWIATLYTTDPRSLELPPVYLHSRVLRRLTTWTRNRRQAEWNDNGETYPPTWEGPDFYTNVDVPDGLFVMSFYHVNDNAHQSRENALRDFELLVKQRNNDVHQPMDFDQFEAAPVLARSRVVNFWSGVYKRFLVQGPAKLTVKICRDYSPSCVVTSALMLDLVDPRPMPYFSTPGEWAQSVAARRSHNEAMTDGTPSWSDTCTACESERDAIAKLIVKLDDLRDWNPQWLALNERRIAVGLARWCDDPAKLSATDRASLEMKAASFYDAGDYPAYEEAQTAAGDQTARARGKALRWDGISNVGGHEYEVLTGNLAALQYAAKHPATRPSNPSTPR